jgi:hypothetical protein
VQVTRVEGTGSLLDEGKRVAADTAVRSWGTGADSSVPPRERGLEPRTNQMERHER